MDLERLVTLMATWHGYQVLRAWLREEQFWWNVIPSKWTGSSTEEALPLRTIRHALALSHFKTVAGEPVR